MKKRRHPGQIRAYLADYRFSSIFLKYFALLLACLMLPVMIAGIWYGRQTRKNLYDELRKQNEVLLEQTAQNVNAVLTSTKKAAYSFSTASHVRYLSFCQTVSDDATNNLSSVQGMISMAMVLNPYIDSIYVYLDQSQEIVMKSGYERREEFDDSEILDLFSMNMEDRPIMLFRAKHQHYPYLLTIAHPIFGEYGGDAMGMTVININVESMGRYIGSGRYRLQDNAPRMLIYGDELAHLVYSDEFRLLHDEQELDEVKSSLMQRQGKTSQMMELWGENYLVSSLEPNADGLNFLYLSPMREFEAQSKAMEVRLWMILALIVLICMALSFVLARWVYQPVQRTIQTLKESAMLLEPTMEAHMDEVGVIQQSILHSKKTQDDMNALTEERLISLHNAQMCALQTQINPHFLFNTLEAIGNAAVFLMNGENQVTDMIYTLGKMMRISLSNETYLVPISEELEHVKMYLKLVEFRFHGRIMLHQQIPESLFGEQIVKLTLQPLIENAVQHGLSHVRDGGEIWLRGEKKGQNVSLYVIDNGDKLGPEDLERLREYLADMNITDGKHIGMRNVDQRLKLVFGEEYGLSVGPSEEGGLCVEIRTMSV